MVIRSVHHADWYVYAYYAQWRTVAVTPFCRTLTSGGAAAVDEKVRVDEEEKNAAGAAAGSTGRPPGTAAALKAAPIFPLLGLPPSLPRLADIIIEIWQCGAIRISQHHRTPCLGG